MKIENLENCSGCHACYSVCSKYAIEMKENKEGFLYPQIDKSKCVKCGLCEKACHSLNSLRKESEYTKAYAAINKDEEIRLNSSSGGIFTAIAEKVIEQGGIVFGAKFAPDFSVVHGFTDTKEGLSDFRGSKYLQSIIGDSYKECKKFLETGRKVLFTGTPCQVQGLKKYLGKDYNNLYAVDFICHGVPSPLLWQKYVDYRAEKNHSNRRNIMKTAFRRKDDGWKLYSISFTFANYNEYRLPLTKDPYMQIFLKNYALRKSCYECSCRGIKRVSDITIADFWGIQNVLPEIDDDKGTSFVVSHSDKGKSLIASFQNCKLFEIDIADGVKYNPSMNESPKYPKQRGTFYEDLNRIVFSKIIRKYAITPVYLRIYTNVRRICILVVRFIIGESNFQNVKRKFKRGSV